MLKYIRATESLFPIPSIKVLLFQLFHNTRIMINAIVFQNIIIFQIAYFCVF